jgi:hypothetical protein
MEMCSWLPGPAASPSRKEPWYQLHTRLGGPQSRFWRYDKEKMLSCRKSNPGLLACSLVTIPTELQLLGTKCFGALVYLFRQINLNICQYILEMAVFWNFASCSLVDIERRFRGAYCLHQQGDLMMEAVNSSETSANVYQTTRRKMTEDSHLHFGD